MHRSRTLPRGYQEPTGRSREPTKGLLEIARRRRKRSRVSLYVELPAEVSNKLPHCGLARQNGSPQAPVLVTQALRAFLFTDNPRNTLLLLSNYCISCTLKPPLFCQYPDVQVHVKYAGRNRSSIPLQEFKHGRVMTAVPVAREWSWFKSYVEILFGCRCPVGCMYLGVCFRGYVNHATQASPAISRRKTWRQADRNGALEQSFVMVNHV